MALADGPRISASATPAGAAAHTGGALRTRLRQRARECPGWLALGGLVLASTLVRAWASRNVPTPWIAPDEMIYGLLGQNLFRDGRLAILGGATPYYSAVVPAVVGLPLSMRDLVLGYSVLKVVQALVMSLAAVPVYLWGRSLLSRSWALAAAALTLALPGLAYSGLVMSEVVFYPVLAAAAWAMAAALESPTRTRQGLFVAALGLAAATRIQAVILVPAFVLAVALDAALARSRARLRAFVPALAAIGILAVAASAWRLAADEPFLGGYAGAGGHYATGRAVEFVAYHAGDLALLSAVIPVCAVGVLLWEGLRRGEAEPRARAYLAVSVSLAISFVLEVGVFASRHVGLLAERDLIGIAPVLFLGLCLWLARDGPGGRRARSVVALIVTASVVAIPVRRFVVPDAFPSAFSVIPLSHLRQLSSVGTTWLAFGGGVGLAAALFAFLPRTRLLVLPAVVGLALVAGSVAASREVVAQAKAQQPRLLGPERRWIDTRAAGPVAYIYDGENYWNAVWETVFWNRRIRWVYDLPATLVPGPLPQQPLGVLPSGVLTSAGAPLTPPFAVAAQNYTLAGEPLASATQVGTDRQAFELWKIDPPLRISTVRFGLLPGGDIDPAAGVPEAGLITYGCNSGSFLLALFAKEPETIRVLLDDRVIRHATFRATGSWYLTIPVHPTSAGANRVCVLKVRPTGLTGTNRFEFERS
jgi:hypothetical protein